MPPLHAALASLALCTVPCSPVAAAPQEAGLEDHGCLCPCHQQPAAAPAPRPAVAPAPQSAAVALEQVLDAVAAVEGEETPVVLHRIRSASRSAGERGGAGARVDVELLFPSATPLGAVRSYRELRDRIRAQEGFVEFHEAELEPSADLGGVLVSGLGVEYDLGRTASRARVRRDLTPGDPVELVVRTLAAGDELSLGPLRISPETTSPAPDVTDRSWRVRPAERERPLRLGAIVEFARALERQAGGVVTKLSIGAANRTMPGAGAWSFDLELTRRVRSEPDFAGFDVPLDSPPEPAPAADAEPEPAQDPQSAHVAFARLLESIETLRSEGHGCVILAARGATQVARGARSEFVRLELELEFPADSAELASAAYLRLRELLEGWAAFDGLQEERLRPREGGLGIHVEGFQVRFDLSREGGRRARPHKGPRADDPLRWIRSLSAGEGMRLGELVVRPSVAQRTEHVVETRYAIRPAVRGRTYAWDPVLRFLDRLDGSSAGFVVTRFELAPGDEETGPEAWGFEVEVTRRDRQR